LKKTKKKQKKQKTYLMAAGFILSTYGFEWSHGE
jgi:hypothetical protein